MLQGCRLGGRLCHADSTLPVTVVCGHRAAALAHQLVGRNGIQATADSVRAHAGRARALEDCSAEPRSSSESPAVVIAGCTARNTTRHILNSCCCAATQVTVFAPTNAALDAFASEHPHLAGSTALDLAAYHGAHRVARLQFECSVMG